MAYNRIIITDDNYIFVDELIDELVWGSVDEQCDSEYEQRLVFAQSVPYTQDNNISLKCQI